MNSPRKVLQKVFGHQEFRLDQEKVIQALLEGKDTLAVMPTGGGKSLCYQIPALLSPGVTLVISPLISLMNDQVINLKEQGIQGVFLNSEQSDQEQQEIKDKVLNGEVRLLYFSPEGALSAKNLSFLQKLNISFIAIDEAHCVSQWGHEFRIDYTRLKELREIFPFAPVLALTATADSKTRHDIATQLDLKNPQIFVSSFDRANIFYRIQERENELKQLESFIKKKHLGETGIVYCLSRKKVEKIAEELKNLGFHAYPYHAGMELRERKRVQEIFNQDEGVIVVATIAFGMGIDRPDVRFVAHLDLPKSIEGYYQETGRAGRDGLEADTLMLYGFQDVIKLSQMLETTQAAPAYKKIARHKLDAMISFCENIHCRRQYLLKYFEQDAPSTCGNCDHCLNPPQTEDASVNAQKILSAIYRTGQVFGAGHVIDVLRGSQGQKIQERKHHELSVYGIGKDFSKNYWSRLLRQLLHLDYIYIKDWEYRSLGLREKSKNLLSGQENFFIQKTSRREDDKKDKLKSMELAQSEHGQVQLFEKLRGLRKRLAEEKGVPPYVIFSDKSLHDMCMILPQDRSQFMLVNGVGSHKCEQYAEVFLKTIQENTLQ